MKSSDEILKMTKKIESSLLNYESQIELDILNRDVIRKQFNRIVDFNPYVFHVKQYDLIHYADHVILEPQYMFDRSTYQDLVISCNKRVKKLSVLVKTSNDVETILRLHKELTSKLSYSDTKNGHDIIDPLFYKKGVCEGFSKLIKAVCNELKIKCVMVTGKFKNSDELHAWNQIKLNECWYNFDITSDLSDNHVESFDYCLVSDDVISVDHEFITPSKGCTSDDLDYYVSNNLIVNGMSSLIDILKKININNLTSFCFKDKSETFDIQTVETVIRKRTKSMRSFSISFNSRLHTYHILFK